MRNKQKVGNIIIVLICGCVALPFLWQLTAWLIDSYIYYSNLKIVDVYVTRRSKTTLDPKVDILFDDYRFHYTYKHDAFYVETREHGTFRTDIDTFDNIGRGVEKFTITRKLGSPEWWIVKDWTIPGPVPDWEGWAEPVGTPDKERAE